MGRALTVATASSTPCAARPSVTRACVERDALGGIAIEGGEYRACAGGRPRQVRPPLRNHRVLRRFDALAGTGRENFHIMAASRHAYTFDGFSPSMLC